MLEETEKCHKLKLLNQKYILTNIYTTGTILVLGVLTVSVKKQEYLVYIPCMLCEEEAYTVWPWLATECQTI